MRRIVLLSLMAPLLAQQGPVNLDFTQTVAEGKPSSWFWIKEPGYSVATLDDCHKPNSRCAVVRYKGDRDPGDFGWIQQSFDATPLRGKQIRYRAWLRVDTPSISKAQLFVRVDRPGNVVGFHNYSHAQPIRSQNWTIREIVGKIDPDAIRISIGLMLGGHGSAYIAEPEFGTVDKEP